jgi:hypothetical protein
VISKAINVTFGTDPEGFFSTPEGKIVGAEKVLPPSGKVGDPYQATTVLDGVQFEMHPYYSTSVRDLAGRISIGFKDLVEHLKMHKDAFKIDFRQVVTVEEDELKTLSDAARRLGCQPSENFYRKRPIKVPDGFPIRSAAGHIHMGFNQPLFVGANYYDYHSNRAYKPCDHRRHLVPLLDIFVGNTCVLLDRDPMAAVRRQLYGHAGEYRKQPHGLEYRTTSNFWLKSFGLMELVFGLANTALQVLAVTVKNEDALGTYFPEKILAEKVNIRDFERAIERNSAKMAWKNWLSIVPFFKEHVPNIPAEFPIHKDNVDEVTKLLKLASEDKLQPFLPEDPVKHWTELASLKLDHWSGSRTILLDPKAEGWTNLLKRITTPATVIPEAPQKLVNLL